MVNKKHVLGFVIIVLIVLFSVNYFNKTSLSGYTQGYNQANDEGDNSWPVIKGLGSGSVKFTHLIINQEDYDYLYPLGHLGAPEHPLPTDHIYFVRFNKISNYSVYSPADGYIINIHKSCSAYCEYSVTIMHSNTFMSWIESIKYLNKSLLKAYESSKNFNSLRIPVKAGDVLGKTDVNLDWGVYDKEVNLNFANPKILGPYTPHTVFPPDYYDNKLKQELYSKIYRVTKPLSGKIDYDIEGKLVGDWFMKGLKNTMSNENANKKELSFVYDMFNGSKIVIAFGGNLGIPAVNYFVENNSPNPKNVGINSGKIIYYLEGTSESGNQNIHGTMIVKMLTNKTIKVEAFNSKVLNPEFTSNAKIYYR